MSDRTAITFDRFLAFAAERERDHWVTLDREAEFHYRVEGREIVFVPRRSDRPRRCVRNEIAKFLAEAERTGSTTQSAYHDITVNASYLLAIRQRLADTSH
jgi:hypothetical protein